MNFIRQSGVLLLIFCLAGCAGTDFKTVVDSPQDTVAKKALARWNALMKGDLDTAYTYLSPGMRSLMTLEQYKKKIKPSMWKKVSVDSVTCAQDSCDVFIKMEYGYRKYQSLGPIETQFKEIWLLEDHEWWFVETR